MSVSYVDRWIEKKTDTADYGELLKYQNGKVSEIIGYVKRNSTFYAEKLKGIDGSVPDIAALPFTFPEDVASFSAQMLCTGQGEVKRIVTQTSSGTTARAKRIFFTEDDLNATVDFFHHGMKEFTSESDSVLIMFPGGKEGSIGQLLAKGIKRLGAKPIIYGIANNFGELLQFVSKTEIGVIAGLPQQLLELSRLCRHEGVSISGIHSVLLSADYVAESVVRAIEENLNCCVYEHYGMTEMCFGGGVYSKLRNGYHMRHGDFLFEIVNPETGVTLPHGEYGEVVFTSLNAEAMPLIRYRTGDIARFAPLCGKYPVMEKVKGRINDGVRLSNGKALTMPALEEALFVNEYLLDFCAAYEEAVLNLYIRSLRFDSGVIMEILQNSAVEETLSGLTVNILPMGNSRIVVNTMNKRSITAFVQ